MLELGRENTLDGFLTMLKSFEIVEERLLERPDNNGYGRNNERLLDSRPSDLRWLNLVRPISVGRWPVIRKGIPRVRSFFVLVATGVGNLTTVKLQCYEPSY